MSDQDERTAELEAKVERLEATVQGLTEELVEVNDRLETLEDAASGDRGRDGAPVSQRDQSADGGRNQSVDEGRAQSTGESYDHGDSRARGEESDGAKSDETQSEDETGDDSDAGDDIIVA